LLIPKAVNYKSKIRNQKNKITKTCAYHNCDTKIVGIGRKKYCEEHQKKKYYDELYHQKYVERSKENDTNQIINHDFIYAVTQICHCDCCRKEFTIKLLPRVYKYPKYCNDHVNEYKRILYHASFGRMENEK